MEKLHKENLRPFFKKYPWLVLPVGWGALLFSPIVFIIGWLLYGIFNGVYREMIAYSLTCIEWDGK